MKLTSKLIDPEIAPLYAGTQSTLADWIERLRKKAAASP